MQLCNLEVCHQPLEDAEDCRGYFSIDCWEFWKECGGDETLKWRSTWVTVEVAPEKECSWNGGQCSSILKGLEAHRRRTPKDPRLRFWVLEEVLEADVGVAFSTSEPLLR